MSQRPRLRAPQDLLVCTLVICLAGCGGSHPSTTSPPVVPPSSNLAGNWLLYGALPKAVGSNTNLPGLGLSLDVLGSAIVGAADIDTTCASGGSFNATFSQALTGTVAADGTFTVKTPAASGTLGFTTLTVSGVVPAQSGGEWAGTYSFVAQTGLGTSCMINQTGPFTASVVQDVTGAYSGSGSLASGGTPLSINLTLHQGAPLYNPLGASTTSSRLGLSGSIQVQGFSCFSKGATSTTSPSIVEGGPLTLSFLMDDGSTMRVLASIDNTSATQLDVDAFIVTSGACNGFYSFFPNPLVVHQ